MKNEPRVLIVESNQVLRAMLFTILRHQPIGVDTAASSEEAMRKVRSCDYALIVVDLDMPDHEGRSFLKRFQEERPDAPTCILAIREPNNDEDLGADAVSAILNKPLEIDTLAELVRECSVAVPPPDDPLPCPPAENDIRARMERGSPEPN